MVFMLSGFGDIGLNVVFLFVLVFSIMFDSCSLDIFGYAVVVWLSLWFMIVSNLHMIHPEGSELDAALSIICENDSFTNEVNCSAL